MFKRNYSLCAIALALGVATTPAHADEWKGVPHVLLFPDGTTVTPDMVQQQRKKVLDHCLIVAYQTIPNKDRTILGHAFTTALASGAGEGSGLAADAAVQGVKVASHAIFGASLLAFLGNIFLGGVAGDSMANDRFRGATDNCLRAQAAGLYSMGPAEADDILTNGPHTAHIDGVSRYWGRVDPAALVHSGS